MIKLQPVRSNKWSHEEPSGSQLKEKPAESSDLSQPLCVRLKRIDKEPDEIFKTGHELSCLARKGMCTGVQRTDSWEIP